MPLEIRIPRLGWSMEEGTFVRWLKNEGDRVEPGDALYELESDKATQEVESMDAGILHIGDDAPQPGDTVAVGALLGYLLGENEPAPEQREGESGRAGDGERALGNAPHPLLSPSPALALRQDDYATHSSQPRESLAAVASPRARRVARELGVDWTGLQGSGREGRVREADVRAASGSPPSSTNREPSPPGVRRRIASRRRTIAERMMAGSHTTAPVTLSTRADATNLVALRRRMQAEGDTAPSYTDMIVSLTAQVLRRHPMLAARWEGNEIVLPTADDFDIAIAVDVEEGLLAPVLRNVCSLSLAELAAQSRDLADRARRGQLAPRELQGGVFTVTNLGAYGIDAFTPIINSPQTAILGLGAIRRAPAVTAAGNIEARNLITLSLTFDHRILDGAPAARFLQDLVRAIETI